MADLHPIKTWGVTRNQVVAADNNVIYPGIGDIATTHKNLLIALYLDLVAHGWTVEGSSDAVTAGMDGVSRLSVAADVRFTSGVTVRSWMVLRQTATGMSVLWHHAYTGTTSQQKIQMYISRNSFTGGSTTTRPIALEEAFVRRGQDTGALGKWHFGDGLSPWRWHHWYSSDGESNMIACFQVGTLNSWWHFGHLRYPQDGWATPWAFACAPGGASNRHHFGFNDNWETEEFQAVYAPDQVFFGAMFPYQTTYSCDNSSGAGNLPIFRTITTINPTSGKIDIFPAGLFAVADGIYGTMGYYFDMYWDGVANSGDIHTDAAGDEWVKLGNSVDGGVFIPWLSPDPFLTA